MKTYPGHHHMQPSATVCCAVCGQPGVAAYMTNGGTQIIMRAIRKRFRRLYR